MPSSSSAGLGLLQLLAPPRIILRRDKQPNSSSESGDIADSASFICVGIFIALCSVALGSEVECLQIAILVFLEETNLDITMGFSSTRKNGLDLYHRAIELCY
jgi:hypothetical protein